MQFLGPRKSISIQLASQATREALQIAVKSMPIHRPPLFRYLSGVKKIREGLKGGGNEQPHPLRNILDEFPEFLRIRTDVEKAFGLHVYPWVKKILAHTRPSQFHSFAQKMSSDDENGRTSGQVNMTLLIASDDGSINECNNILLDIEWWVNTTGLEPHCGLKATAELPITSGPSTIPEFGGLRTVAKQYLGNTKAILQVDTGNGNPDIRVKVGLLRAQNLITMQAEPPLHQIDRVLCVGLARLFRRNLELTDQEAQII